MVLFSWKLTTASEIPWVRCPLVWEPLAAGEAIPRLAVEVDPEEYIVRCRLPNDKFQIGRLDQDRQYGMTPISDSINEISSIFEILTNPNECEMKWFHVSQVTSDQVSSNCKYM